MSRPSSSDPAARFADSSLDGEKLKAVTGGDPAKATNLTTLELQTLARNILKLLREELRSENESQGRSLHW
jgi:hypothetical protein